MRVLIACEFSGVVRRAFQARGHTAWSCDLVPAKDREDAYHLQMDAIEAIRGRNPDLVIAHPPCTYLCNSGVLRLYTGGKKVNGIDADRWAKMMEAAVFFESFFREYSGPLCVENPVMHGHARELIEAGPHVRQTIQPHQFGEDASKATVLWLRGLPELKPTRHIAPRMVDGRPRWANQTDGGQNKLAPSPDRGAKRSVTYAGIAEAMAAQWG